MSRRAQGRTSAEGNLPCLGCPCLTSAGFASLRCLLLGGCRLASWASVDQLDRFPALEEARLSDNPLTAAAFAVLATGLAQRWSAPADRGAFVVGVAVASAVWQSVLAVAGGLLGARVRGRSDGRLRRVLGVGGFGLVGFLAVVLAIG